MAEPIKVETGQTELEEWLEETGRRLTEFLPLPGDVSPRKYARLAFEDGVTAILATYPPEIEAVCPRFLRTTALLEGVGVRAPRVLAAACDRGWMLVEDLGPRTLGDFKGRPWSELAAWFEHALDLAERIAGLPPAEVADLNPPLGFELMKKELAQTWDLFLTPKELTGRPALESALRAALDEICANLAAEPAVPCHRDFMARNLMPLSGGALAVLDHQDLRLGPPAYDLASLLNDTLFPPPEAEEALLARVPRVSRVQYHRAAAQRTLKAVGTYTSFARRGADRHLPLVGPTLARCLEHLARVPESAGLAEDLGGAWAPVLQSSWE
jgi:hypothetical protein